jgi:hypothetical protein
LKILYLKKDFKGIQDGVASVVKAKFTRDRTVGQIAAKCIQAMTGSMLEYIATASMVNIWTEGREVL